MNFVSEKKYLRINSDFEVQRNVWYFVCTSLQNSNNFLLKQIIFSSLLCAVILQSFEWNPQKSVWLLFTDSRKARVECVSNDLFGLEFTVKTLSVSVGTDGTTHDNWHINCDHNHSHNRCHKNQIHIISLTLCIYQFRCETGVQSIWQVLCFRVVW